MPAGKLNLVIEQRATFRRRLIYKNKFRKPYDLTGFGAHMQVRDKADNLIADLTTANGGLVVNAVPGAIDIYISDEDTSTMTAAQFLGASYDIKLLAPGGDKPRILQGSVKLNLGVTREEEAV